MRFSRWIASAGGIGDIPFVPGIVAVLIGGTIGGIALWADPRLLTFLAILACLLGLWAVHATGETSDKPWIVIDEFAGLWIGMLGLARASAAGVVAAVVIFILLNLFKPGPVGWADRKDGAISVMADDIVAGLLTAAILFLIRFIPPGLFAGWLPVDQLP